MTDRIAALGASTLRRFGIELSSSLILATFAATLFVSALMLFSVQPMFAKMALPRLGGTPSVWAVSMCFFQAALLAGYCYAHALNRWLKPVQAVQFHLALMLVTYLVLPIGLPAALAEPPEGDAYLWLLGVLTLGVGLPFFAVSASAPLLQAWFAGTGHEDAKDPYFLYGASNLGSLIALVAYPLALEPAIGLNAQSHAWSAGFVVLAFLIAASGAIMLVCRAAAPAVAMPSSGQAAALATIKPLTAEDRALWVALAAVPSGLMVAVTTHITTDVASAPFIWVIPLALFLGTFILVFKDKLAFNYRLATDGLPFAILALVCLPVHLAGVLIALAAFFMAAIVCHRELYLKRPDAAHLTEFYIWMSAGGVIGGVFSALIAPKIFATVAEFKLLLLVAMLCRPGVLLGLAIPARLSRFALTALAMIAPFLAYKWLASSVPASLASYVLGGFIALTLAGLFQTRKWPEHRALLVMGMIIAFMIVPGDSRTIYTERSFFGTMRVMLSEHGTHRLMLHGTTTHGAQRIFSDTGVPATTPEPATYYHLGGAMVRGVEVARKTAIARGQVFSVGVVGLGTGSLACTAKPNESWRYYELDPMVARIARDPHLFNYLSHCLPNNEIIFGDARLTLQKEPDAKFNHLVIDAFSSDAIPVHLMTREAIEIYLKKLAPGGVIAMHISNRFLDLAPAIAATVATLPGVKAVMVDAPATKPHPDAEESLVIFLTRDDAAFTEIKSWKDAAPIEAGGTKPWTDDYSDVLSALIRRLTG
jgi:spermidine synthase